MFIFLSGNESLLRNSITNLSSKSMNCSGSNASFTQKPTIVALQDNDLDSELAVPLKDTEDDIEPPPKKKCSMEIMVPTLEPLGESLNKFTPAIARLKSTCLTPVASKSFLDNLKTPDTPYGQIFYDHPVTPETKKKWKKYVLNSYISIMF